MEPRDERKKKQHPVLEQLDHKRVPVLPPGVPELLKSLTDDNIDFATLATIIKRFPTIAGRLIGLANSAWSSPADTLCSLEAA